MNVVVLIDGREAIPVRAIPFVTASRLSPDTLVDLLIPVSKFPDPMQPEALRLDKGTQSWSKFDCLQWDGIRHRLQRLARELNPKKKPDHKTQADWMDGAIERLPAGVFLWREDLERCIQAFDMRDYDEERAVFDFSPHIPSNMCDYVREGFERLLPVDTSPMRAEQPVSGGSGRSGIPTLVSDGKGEQADPPPPTMVQEQSKIGETKEVLLKRRAFIDAFQRMWPSIERDLKDSSRNDLSDEAKFKKHGFWCVKPALNWAAQRGKIQGDSAEAFVRAEPESELSVLVRALLDRK